MRQWMGACILVALFGLVNVHAQQRDIFVNNQILEPVEEVVLPQQNIRVRARVDTGAQKSSLHATNIHLIEENKKTYVRFELVDDAGNHYARKEKLQSITKVTNTSGRAEKRFEIRTDVILKNKIFTVDVNLKDRTNMQYKFLIGRDLLKKAGYRVEISL